MRKAIMVMLSIAVAVIVTSQADAKGKKTTPRPFVFIKHYDKSSPVLALKQQTRSTPKPTTSGSSQMKGRR
jgi:type VI protein secretion system component Hcp